MANVVKVDSIDSLEDLTSSVADDLIEVGDVTNRGGLFIAKSTSSILNQSSVTLRFLPYCYKAQFKVKGPGVAGDTITIGGTTITIVSGEPGANEVKVQATVDALASALMSLLNVNSQTITVRARHQMITPPDPEEPYALASLWANAPGPPVPNSMDISATGTTFDSIQQFSDPGADTKLEFGTGSSNKITFVSGTAGPFQVTIGATPDITAENFSLYVTANSATLGWIAARSGFDVTLTPNSLDGLVKLRALAKGSSGCPVFTVQARKGAAADSLSAIYIPSKKPTAENPDFIYVRQSFLSNNELSPLNWGIKGNGLDAPNILPILQAMFDFAHWSGASVKLTPNAVYDITTDPAGKQKPLLIRGGIVYGKNATILNTANIGTEEVPNICLNGGILLGVGHPAFDSQVSFFNINEAVSGSKSIEFTNSTDAEFFRSGDIVPIATESGRYTGVNWLSASRVLYKLVARAGGIWTIDRPIETTFPSGSRAELWMGSYDAVSKSDLTVADSPKIRDLNIVANNGAAMARTQVYNADCSFGYINGIEGLFFNSLHGTVRAARVCSEGKAIELAHNSQRASIYVDEIEWRSTSRNAKRPMIKSGEYSRDWVIEVGILSAGVGFEDDFFITVAEGSRGYLQIRNSYFADLTGKAIFLLIDNNDAQPGEIDADFKDLSIDLGLVQYLGIPTNIIRIQNFSGGVENIWLTGGTISGATPTLNGAHFSSVGGGTQGGVAMPGMLRIDTPATNGTYRGRFGVAAPGVGGLNPSSTGKGDVDISRGENNI